VNIFFAAATATAGVAIGWGQRTIIFRLRDRIAEARQKGWKGEVAGLEVSIAAVEQKLRLIDELTARHTVTYLGMPNFSSSVGRASPDVRPCPP
jgi:hypothetical protein